MKTANAFNKDIRFDQSPPASPKNKMSQDLDQKSSKFGVVVKSLTLKKKEKKVVN
jgi:hypothetical protein